MASWRMDRPTLDAVRLLTFDCYGTLVDWERAVMGAFARHVCPDYYVGQLADVVERWEEIQFGLISGGYRSYREILAESVTRTVQELELPAPAEPGFLAEAIATADPFPDSREALRRLAGRAPLWLLSNIDADLLAETVRRLEAPIARCITAEEVRSYKPSPAHFEKALAESGLAPGAILHVAFGFKYDIVPAASLGMRTAWINRAGDAPPEGVTPDVALPDLRSLADLLAA